MVQSGTAVEMTKGYKGVKGEVLEKVESLFEFYVVRLQSGIHLVAGPSAFVVLPAFEEDAQR